MYVAGAIETVLAVLLILGIWTPYAAAIAAIHLLVAAAATWRVSNGKWLWHIGGMEYPVFWALACVVLALLTWPAV
jgi:putative oxidoreductase